MGYRKRRKQPAEARAISAAQRVAKDEHKANVQRAHAGVQVQREKKDARKNAKADAVAEAAAEALVTARVEIERREALTPEEREAEDAEKKNGDSPPL